ncbi:MFS transporter [Paraburkholderia sp. BCC1885]|uniref:MFS transporter n=1 Tax=Paraburkholderia sp. BCC1885 TaxID=2562669 RepID=UPI0011844A86|nr:MFS transporter [Paraburkholderia sp. BCC1885]
MQNRLLVLLCVSVPSFMINLDANIVAVSLSSIARSLHADFAAIEWVISAYTLAFATLVMPAGALADRFGRKRMLVVGLAVFTLASGICGAATSTTVLNYARALQGVGAALQLSAALAILAHSFQGRERASAFAFWGSVIGVAIMLGPVAGGLITQFFGWQWAFYVNLPVGAAMIALTLYAVKESKDPHAMRVDTAGVLTFSGFLGMTTLALISGNRDGWFSRAILAELGVAVVMLIAFLWVETIQARPMVDLKYFLRRTYLGANIAGVAYAVAFLTMLTYLPFFFQSALGYAPLTAGLLMLPLAVPLFVVPRIVALYLDKRLSGRTLLVIGLACVSVGLLLTAWHITLFHYPVIFESMLIASMGAGILNGQIAKVSMTVIPVERAGMASGVSGTMRFSGIVVGFAALGAVLFARIGASVADALPDLAGANRLAITHAIADGNLTSATALIQAHGGAASIARASLGYGYEGVLLSAGLVALAAAVLSWWLVSAAETAPHEAATPQVMELSVD